MGTKNISISDEAYRRLAALKAPRESFTDAIIRITGGRSLLELAGTLTEVEAAALQTAVKEIHHATRNRVTVRAPRLKRPR